jgi:hypothetical protein
MPVLQRRPRQRGRKRRLQQYAGPDLTGISEPPEKFGKDAAIAIPDPNGKAGYLQTDKTAENSGTLLEHIIYNIVQASQTPKFLLGTAVDSSKASVSEQITVIVAKARMGRRRRHRRRLPTRPRPRPRLLVPAGPAPPPPTSDYSGRTANCA